MESGVGCPFSTAGQPFNTAELRDANRVINAQETLVDDVASFFWPCHTTHDRAGGDHFHRQKGYPFRFYRLSPDAARVFDETFDVHVRAQEASHLTDQEQAKFHGKAKTKHLRLALALHLFEETRQRHTIETWSTTLDSRHLVVAEKLGEYLDMVAERMSGLFKTVLSDVPDRGAPAGAARSARASVREQLEQVLQADWQSFRDIPEDKAILFWQLGQHVLNTTAVWVESTAVCRHAGLRALLSSLGDYALAPVARLLQHLGLTTTVRGKNTHGTPVFYIVKRELTAELAEFTALTNIISEFEIGMQGYRSYPATAVQQHQPNNAASSPSFLSSPVMAEIFWCDG